VKEIYLHSVFPFIILLLAIINIEITATEPATNVISSLKKSIHLNYWQIAEDKEPNNYLPILPDSLWQLFESTLDDNRYTEGNWLIRTNIIIQDSI
jgi:hypothetical protein